MGKLTALILFIMSLKMLLRFVDVSTLELKGLYFNHIFSPDVFDMLNRWLLVVFLALLFNAFHYCFEVFNDVSADRPFPAFLMYLMKFTWKMTLICFISNKIM